MNAPRRNKTRIQDDEIQASPITSILLWSIGLLLLVTFAIASWIGSFYIFGHPEESFSYKILQSLKKIEAPKRFELTAAPHGDFLTPENLFKLYGNLKPRELEELNNTLLRQYIRNYQNTKTAIPYIIGQFTILDSFPLDVNDFFPSGVVAIARANQDPRVILEHIFPAPIKNIPNLERMLSSGLELNLQRRLDLSVVVHVEKLRDGRIKLTAMPLLYGDYASTQGSGTFSLEPPESLNVGAGLPVVRAARLEAAAEKYTTLRRKAGLPSEDSGIAANTATNQLLRVTRPEAVEEEPPPAPLPSPSPSPIPEAKPVLPALPVANEEETLPPIATATPLPKATPPAVAKPTPVVAKTTPTPSPTPSDAIANARGKNWQVYEPGKMPRGRLAPIKEMPELATQGLSGERIYLQGDFEVTAANQERAVLRSQSVIRNPLSSEPTNVRVIVDFPAGSVAPGKGDRISRNSSRPFLITNITRSKDGQIDVHVREITKP